MIQPASPDSVTYHALAALVSSSPAHEIVDFEYDTADEILVFDQNLVAAGAPVTRLCAWNADLALLGFGHTFRVPWTSRPNHYWGVVRVAALARRQGLGLALYQRLLEHARAQGGVSFALELRLGNPELMAACQRHGLNEVFRSVPFVCNPQQVVLDAFLPIEQRVAAHGIRILPLPQLQQHDAAWLPKLHQLFVTLSRDVPIPERAAIPVDQFADFLQKPPYALPEACFVAIQNARYVGMSYLQQAAPMALNQKLTGVLPEMRGKGLAVALKLATLRYAIASGYSTITTWVETNNSAMLGINQRLGFSQGQGGIVVYETRLDA